MFNPRYIVVNQEFGWRIIQGGRRFPGEYPSKTQAICSAIAFAEQDGNAGRRPAVLVQHEDGRFITECGTMVPTVGRCGSIMSAPVFLLLAEVNLVGPRRRVSSQFGRAADGYASR